MSRDLLLAEAAHADADADAIFDAMSRASEIGADRTGVRELIPAGWHARAERASDLRRKAKWLRAEAAALAASKIKRPTAALASPPPVPPPPLAAEAKPLLVEPKRDPVCELVARILEA